MNCLVEPMKIAFNFGNSEYSYMSNYFDMDIKVVINDPLEISKPVGWRCGNTQTKYLSWKRR